MPLGAAAETASTHRRAQTASAPEPQPRAGGRSEAGLLLSLAAGAPAACCAGAPGVVAQARCEKCMLCAQMRRKRGILGATHTRAETCALRWRQHAQTMALHAVRALVLVCERVLQPHSGVTRRVWRAEALALQPQSATPTRSALQLSFTAGFHDTSVKAARGTVVSDAAYAACVCVQGRCAAVSDEL